MGDKSRDTALIAAIIAIALIAFFGVIQFAGSPRSDFGEPADINVIEHALTEKGLKLCAQGDIAWETTPGFISGKFYDLSLNCSDYDPNEPGARIWVLKFGSIEARDAALRNIEIGRRHFGSGMAWTKGPFVIMADGSRKDEVAEVLNEALSNSSAK